MSALIPVGASALRGFTVPPRVPVAGLSFIASLVLVLAVAASADGALGPRDRHLISPRHGLSVEAPAGWTLSQHTGYGETVVLLLHPDGGRISVTAAPTKVPSATALYEENRKGLVTQGLQPSAPTVGPRGFLSVEIDSPARAERLRQLYLVRDVPGGRQAIVLTLVCRATAFAEHRTALDFVATNLGLEDPIARNLASPSGAGGAGGESAGELRSAPGKRDAAAKQVQKR